MDFRDRYAIESFPGGDGVLVDLVTGGYFRLNVTAVIVCEALRLAGTIDAAIERVAEQMKVSVPEAERLIAAVHEDLTKVTAPEEPVGPFHYATRPDGSSLFLEDGRTIFSVDGTNQVVTLQASLNELKVPLGLYLRSLMPKLLVLLDVPVLHASACWVRGGLLVLSGKSGAGKTTTARAFERAGARLVSEDLVVLSLAGESLEIFTAGETFARAWASEAASHLEKTPDRRISFAPLLDAPRGPTAPLTAMWFIQATRRAGSEIRLRPLPVGDGVAALLANGFLATANPNHWRDFLVRSRLIAERTDLSEATMPDGLGQLGEASGRYIVNSAS